VRKGSLGVGGKKCEVYRGKGGQKSTIAQGKAISKESYAIEDRERRIRAVPLREEKLSRRTSDNYN